MSTGLQPEVVQLLLIEDEEDDAVIARSLLSDIRGIEFDVDWVSTYEEALRMILQNHHQVCLLDYCLGSRTGLELLGEALQYGCRIPIIMMTGTTDREIDFKAMKLGAADYVIKGEIDPPILERVIRHAKERKKAETEREELHAKLMETSRQLGMADIATNVLHNVGNVLNSLNVSAGQVCHLLRNAHIKEVGRVAELLHEHTDDMGSFMTEHAKGKLIPKYIEELGKDLSVRVAQTLQEMDTLVSQIDHLKQVIDAQQDIAKPVGLKEPVRLQDLMDQALMISHVELEQHNIEIVKDYAVLPQMILDKHQILQILVNVIRNAKHAMIAKKDGSHRLTLEIQPYQEQEGHVKVQVCDTGVGISPELLTRIFAQGFTTKNNGHGIGLHSSALAAKNCGGSLNASSAGEGCGATFTLVLPYEVVQVTGG